MPLAAIQTNLLEKLNEALKAVLPIMGIVLLLSFTIAPLPSGILLLFLFGGILLILGMMFFNLGAELSMTPMGEKVGKKMAEACIWDWYCFFVFSSVLLSPSQSLTCRYLPDRFPPFRI